MRAKLYANRHGKAEGRQNKLQLSMDREEAESIANGERDALKTVVASIKDALREDTEE